MSPSERAKEYTSKQAKIAEKVNVLLFDADPMRLNFGDNTDEYQIEADQIVEMLHTAKSADEVTNMVFQVFSALFDNEVTPLKETFSPVATQIWLAYNQQL